jgi:hypothetical protein
LDQQKADANDLTRALASIVPARRELPVTPVSHKKIYTTEDAEYQNPPSPVQKLGLDIPAEQAQRRMEQLHLGAGKESEDADVFEPQKP